MELKDYVGKLVRVDGATGPAVVEVVSVYEDNQIVVCDMHEAYGVTYGLQGFDVADVTLVDAPVTPAAATADAKPADVLAHPVMIKVCDALARIGRKATFADVMASKTLANAAIYYVDHYRGGNDFMLSIQRQYDAGYTLSAKQLAGVLNCLFADWRRASDAAGIKPAAPATAAKPAASAFAFDMASAPAAKTPTAVAVEAERATQAAQQAAAPVVEAKPATVKRAVPNGTYTVAVGADRRTLRLTDAPERYNKPAGTQIAAFLAGGDNDADYIGFAFVAGREVQVWKKFSQTSEPAVALRLLVSGDAEAWRKFGEAYAVASGICFICGRKLTVPASLYAGMGKVCADKVGVAYGKTPTAADTGYAKIVAAADELFS